MNTHTDKTQENTRQSVASLTSQKLEGSEYSFQFEDNRPQTIAQRKVLHVVKNNPKTRQLKAVQDMANSFTTQQQVPIQRKENNTGLPDNLKSGIENLSGYSMDDVKVHYNSDKPAQLNAHAYAQGTDIHIASGQEKHLPHEAWHVVQQKQGRVRPTMQMKGKVNINDDEGLEKEADVMGNKALNYKGAEVQSLKTMKIVDFTVQRKTWNDLGLDNIVEGARRRMQNLATDPQLQTLDPQKQQELSSRVDITLYRLELGLQNDWLAYSSDLEKKLGALLSTKPSKAPNDGDNDADVIAKDISESLSELEHAADVVLRSTALDGEIAMSEVFIGIRGSNDEGKADMPDIANQDIIGRDNTLPGIDEPKLEADVYYKDGNGFVHVVEVKDSVNALISKLGKEKQYLRQISWLRKRSDDYGRIVEYFIQSPIPFHRLLDDKVIDPFGEIEDAQDPKGQAWFKLGDEKFSYPDFVKFYEAAMNVFGPLLKKYKLGPSGMVGVFLDMFFVTKEIARASIADPQAIEETKAAQNEELVKGLKAKNTQRILALLQDGKEITGLERAIIKETGE